MRSFVTRFFDPKSFSTCATCACVRITNALLASYDGSCRSVIVCSLPLAKNDIHVVVRATLYTSCKCACAALYAILYIRNHFHIFTHGASRYAPSSIRRHTLQRLTEAVPLPNLHGSKVQLANTLGLLVHILLHVSCLVDHD